MLLCTRHCVRHFLFTISLTFLSKLVRCKIRSPFTDKETDALNGKVTWPRSHDVLVEKVRFDPGLVDAEVKASPFPWYHVASHVDCELYEVRRRKNET